MSTTFLHDNNEIKVGQDVRVHVDLGDGLLAVVILTHEGVITDIYSHGEAVATSSQTYDEMADALATH